MSHGDDVVQKEVLEKYLGNSSSAFALAMITSISQYLNSKTKDGNLSTHASNARDSVIEACRFSCTQQLKDVCNVLDIGYRQEKNDFQTKVHLRMLPQGNMTLQSARRSHMIWQKL